PEDRTPVPGLVVPLYVVGFDTTIGEAQMDAIFDLCDTQEFRWISSAYQSQPTSRELISRHVTAQEPHLRACLEREGIQTEPDATGWELAMFAVSLGREPDIGLECLLEADISGF